MTDEQLVRALRRRGDLLLQERRTMGIRVHRALVLLGHGRVEDAVAVLEPVAIAPADLGRPAHKVRGD